MIPKYNHHVHESGVFFTFVHIYRISIFAASIISSVAGVVQFMFTWIAGGTPFSNCGFKPRSSPCETENR